MPYTLNPISVQPPSDRMHFASPTSLATLQTITHCPTRARRALTPSSQSSDNKISVQHALNSRKAAESVVAVASITNPQKLQIQRAGRHYRRQALYQRTSTVASAYCYLGRFGHLYRRHHAVLHDYRYSSLVCDGRRMDRQIKINHWDENSKLVNRRSQLHWYIRRRKWLP
jgi:hypothetical protein